jgi:hypothetical protein
MIRTPDHVRDEIRKAREAGESLKEDCKAFWADGANAFAILLAKVVRFRWNSDALKII